MKNAYYFSHDGNARMDEKIMMLRAKHGWEGYGIYWVLIETMFESSETAIKHKSITAVGEANNIVITLLQAVINTCITEHLFAKNSAEFWSESLRKRKGTFEDSAVKKSLAGKKGMESRWGKAVDTALHNNVITPLCQYDNNVITKNNKVKESKVNIYTPDFDTFYAMYPNPFDRQQTFKNFKSTLKHDTIDNILLAVRNYVSEIEANGTEKRYIKRSTNFLGKEQAYKGYLEIIEHPRRGGMTIC